MLKRAVIVFFCAWISWRAGIGAKDLAVDEIPRRLSEARTVLHTPAPQRLERALTAAYGETAGLFAAIDGTLPADGILLVYTPYEKTPHGRKRTRLSLSLQLLRNLLYPRQVRAFTQLPPRPAHWSPEDRGRYFLLDSRRHPVPPAHRKGFDLLGEEAPFRFWALGGEPP